MQEAVSLTLGAAGRPGPATLLSEGSPTLQRGPQPLLAMPVGHVAYRPPDEAVESRMMAGACPAKPELGLQRQCFMNLADSCMFAALHTCTSRRLHGGMVARPMLETTTRQNHSKRLARLSN